MALKDTISQVAGGAVSAKNRVDVLLEQWEGTEDGETFLAALNNPDITSAALTRAVRLETKTHSVLKDSSIAEWRRKNAPTEVDGL